MAKQDSSQPRVPEGDNKNLYAIGEEESEVNDEATDNEEEWQAWSLLEESEHEPW